MKLFFGLGNPDKKYLNTRHNLGQSVILSVAKDLNFSSKLSSKFSKTDHLFAISSLHMNESGLSVKKLVDYFKISPADLYLIHDDLDLGAGEWRLQFDRGPAGHKGVASTIDQLGTQAFWRFRLGIGHPTNNIPVEDYVLLPFTSPEKVLINQTIDKITEEIKKLL